MPPSAAMPFQIATTAWPARLMRIPVPYRASLRPLRLALLAERGDAFPAFIAAQAGGERIRRLIEQLLARERTARENEPLGHGVGAGRAARDAGEHVGERRFKRRRIAAGPVDQADALRLGSVKAMRGGRQPPG